MDSSTPSAPKPISQRIICEQVVLPGESGLRIIPATIDIASSHIVAIHEATSVAPPIDPSVPCEILHNSLLSPSFIDAHTHLALTCLRGLNPSDAVDTNLVEAFFYKIEAHMTADDVRAFVRIGGLEAMMSGTGLVWDHYYYPEAIAAGLRDIGLSGVVAPTLQDRGGPGIAALDANLEATLTIATSDTMRRDGIYSALGLHASDTVSKSLLRRCADLASKYQLPIHSHVAQSYEELERVHRLDGCGAGEHFLRSGILDSAPNSLLVHGILLTDLELEKLGKKNVTLAFCPHSKQIFAYLPDLQRWLKHDVEWVVGTDCAASNDAWSIPRELRFVAGMRALSVGWSQAQQAYLDTGRLAHAQDAWAARTAARSESSVLGDDSYILARGWKVPGRLHPSFYAGEITVGARAQFAVWDTAHPCFWPNKNLLRSLVWGRTQGALKRLMVNGAWWSDQDHMGYAVTESDLWRESAKEASERLEALLQRAR